MLLTPSFFLQLTKTKSRSSGEIAASKELKSNGARKRFQKATVANTLGSLCERNSVLDIKQARPEYLSCLGGQSASEGRKTWCGSGTCAHRPDFGSLTGAKFRSPLTLGLDSIEHLPISVLGKDWMKRSCDGLTNIVPVTNFQAPSSDHIWGKRDNKQRWSPFASNLANLGKYNCRSKKLGGIPEWSTNKGSKRTVERSFCNWKNGDPFGHKLTPSILNYPDALSPTYVANRESQRVMGCIGKSPFMKRDLSSKKHEGSEYVEVIRKGIKDMLSFERVLRRVTLRNRLSRILAHDRRRIERAYCKPPPLPLRHKPLDYRSAVAADLAKMAEVPRRAYVDAVKRRPGSTGRFVEVVNGEMPHEPKRVRKESLEKIGKKEKRRKKAGRKPGREYLDAVMHVRKDPGLPDYVKAVTGAKKRSGLRPGRRSPSEMSLRPRLPGRRLGWAWEQRDGGGALARLLPPPRASTSKPPALGGAGTNEMKIRYERPELEVFLKQVGRYSCLGGRATSWKTPLEEFRQENSAFLDAVTGMAIFQLREEPNKQTE